jgi:hypothetical protein
VTVTVPGESKTKRSIGFPDVTPSNLKMYVMIAFRSGNSLLLAGENRHSFKSHLRVFQV